MSTIARLAALASLACIVTILATFVCPSSIARADTIETLDVNVSVPGEAIGDTGLDYMNRHIGGTLTYDLTTDAFLYGSVTATRTRQ